MYFPFFIKMENPQDSVSLSPQSNFQNNDNDNNIPDSSSENSPISSNGSKYIIEEVPFDFHYDQDHFNQMKFLDVAHSFRIVPKKPSQSYMVEFTKLQKYIQSRIEFYLESVRATKIHVTLYCRFWRNNTDPIIEKDFHIDQKSVGVLQTDDVGEITRKIMDKFQDRVLTKLELESDYVYDKLIHADLIFCKWSPIRGNKHIDTPLYLKRYCRSLINIRNQDEMCLVWAILAILFPTKRDRKNPRVYEKHLPQLNLTDMDFSSDLTLKDAKSLLIQMEKNNEKLSICCYVIDESDKNINVFYISDRYDVSNDLSLREVNLLLIEKDSAYHFVAITNLRALTRNLHTKHRGSKFQLCRRCLSMIYSEKKYEEHQILCKDMEASVYVLPEKDTVYSYKDHPKEVPLAFSAYCDFESYMSPVLGCDPEPVRGSKKYSWIQFEKEAEHALLCNNCTEVSACSSIKPLQTHGRHVAYAYGLKIQCFFEGYYDHFPLIIDYGPEDELLTRFLMRLRDYCTELYETVNSPRGIIMTKENEREFEDALRCKYCHREFDDKYIKKKRDHCHLRGIFRYYYNIRINH